MNATGATWRVGAAAGLTAGLAFAACALAFSFWPGAAVAFLNSLFDGVDFAKLPRDNELFDYAGFLGSLVVVMGSAFGLGAMFALINQAIAAWQSRARPAAIDPVCGMTVDPQTADGPMDYRGRRYYFCCGRCHDTFAADPQRYAARTQQRVPPIGAA